MKDLYSGSVRVTGGRNGRAVSDDGILRPRACLSEGPWRVGRCAEPRTAVSHRALAACFNSSLRHAARSLGHEAGDVAVHATATLTLAEDGAYGVKLAMELELPGLTADKDAAVIAEARRICAYSNATRGQVDVAITVWR